MLSDRKLTDAKFTGNDVVSLPDRPSESGLTAAQIKQQFDKLVKVVVADNLNGLIVDLESESGADFINALKGGAKISIQDWLELLQSATDTFLTAEQVLTKTNSVVFFPTNPYEPATKQYVDLKVVEIGSADMAQGVYDTKGKRKDIFDYADKRATNSYNCLSKYNSVTNTYEVELLNAPETLPELFSLNFVADANAKAGAKVSIINREHVVNLYGIGYKEPNIFSGAATLLNNGYANFDDEGVKWGHAISKKLAKNILKTSTQYTIIADIKNSNLGQWFYLADSNVTIDPFAGAQVAIKTTATGVQKFSVVTKSAFTDVMTLFRHIAPSNTVGAGNITLRPMLLEGDWTNREIPASYWENTFGEYPILTYGENSPAIEDNVFFAGQPVTLQVGLSGAFFKVGGGGSSGGQLPNPPISFKATSKDGGATLAIGYDINDTYLTGFFVVYKQGGIPQNIYDGTKIDIGKVSTYELTGLTNGLEYSIRIFPYNSKKQVQNALLNSLISVIPMNAMKISDLPIGTKVSYSGIPVFIKGGDNLSGHQVNSVALVTLDITTWYGILGNDVTTSKYSTSNMRNKLITTEYDSFPTYIQEKLLAITANCGRRSSYPGTSETVSDKVVLLSATELGITGCVADGEKIPYFDTVDKRKCGKAYITRTVYGSMYNQDTQTSSLYWYQIQTSGIENSTSSSGYARYMISVSSDTLVYPTPDENGVHKII